MQKVTDITIEEAVDLHKKGFDILIANNEIYVQESEVKSDS